jgi:hypothetical protein
MFLVFVASGNVFFFVASVHFQMQAVFVLRQPGELYLELLTQDEHSLHLKVNRSNKNQKHCQKLQKPKTL